MKKSKSILIMSVSSILTVIAVIVLVCSWRKYRMASETLELLDKIFTEMEQYREERAKELESYLADSIMPLPEADELPDMRMRLMMSGDHLLHSMGLPQPR